MSQVSAVIKEMIRQQLLTLHTCLVCKVLELYSDGTAKVQPCTMMQTAKGTVKQHVALDGVPILDQIRSTVSIGKACVVVFAERDISAVRYAEFALPSASRHHSLSDGIIIGTIDGSGTVIPGESSAPLPSETATAKTSTNKKINGTEVQVDVKVSRQSGNKLQAKSDGLFVPESPDTNTTYNISKDGSALKLTGSDGSESSVAIPESKNTTYRVLSGIFPSSHGVTLRGSDGSNSIAPLETYRRSLYLPDATAKNMERVTDRGYLYSTHGYAFTLTMSRYDSSHHFEMSGTYSKDDESFDFIIHGDISVGQGVPVITNLSIECNDPDNQLSVYAYNVFEPASEDHDYVHYYAWLAVYSKKDLTGWTSAHLASIHYTDGEYIEPSTPPDSEHSVNYIKMEEQVGSDSDSTSPQIKYSEYQNTESVFIGSGQEAAAIAMRIVSYKATDVMFFAEITLQVETDETITDTEYICTDGTVTAAYYVGGAEIGAFQPSWTLQDGTHTIHLVQHFAVSSVAALDFQVRISTSGCRVTIPAMHIHAVVEGAYLAGEEAWDGMITASDTIEMAVSADSIRMASLTDQAEIAEKEVQRQTITDTVRIAVTGSDTVVTGFKDAVQSEITEEAT